MKRAYWVGFVVVLGLGCGQERPQETLEHELGRLTAPTTVNSFALLSTGRATLQDRTIVSGGHVGVAPGTGDSLTAGFDAKVALGRSTLGQRVVQKDRSAIGDLFATTVVGALGTHTSLSPYAVPPVAPPIVAFTAGSSPLTVSSPQTLAAGDYGALTVNSTLTLSGGTYEVQSITLGVGGVVQASSASILRVAGRIAGGNNVKLVPTGTQGAANLRIIVAGATDAAGGIVLGTDATLTALIVSRASFQAGDRLTAKGALAARNLGMGIDSRFTFQTGFECNTDIGCDDANPCTSDACVDARCVHPALPNGTACTDDANVCTTDACNSGLCAHPALPNGTACTGDSNDCTTDQCQAGACAHPALADGTACPNEGNPCTNDACAGGVCAHPPVANGTVCPSDGKECTNDVCLAGDCSHAPLSDGTPCRDDLRTCTNDACLAGDCSHLPVADGTTCDNDSNECTTDVCATGNCTHPVIPDLGFCQTADAVTPLFECVTTGANGRNRAVFGYQNDTGSTVHATPGPGNSFLPSPGVRGQPNNFLPGHAEHAFAVDFFGASITWYLGGHAARAFTAGPICAADGCSPTCGDGFQCVTGTCVAACGDGICAGEDCESCPFDCSCLDNPRPLLVDRPSSIHGVPGLLASVPPASQAGSAPGFVETALGAMDMAPADAAPTGPFTFKITRKNYSGGEGLCGSVDPYAKNLIINGVKKGRTDSGTVLVPTDQDTVPVHVEIWDSDGGFCLGDDRLATFDLDVDNFSSGGEVCTAGGDGSICWRATGAENPDVCLTWPAHFVDSGPFGGGVASEDFLATTAVQNVPASFALADLTLQRMGATAYTFHGYLDEDGCIPGADRPERALWQGGAQLVATFKLTAEHCLDPSGKDCALDTSSSTPQKQVFFGASSQVLLPNATAPAAYCTALTENPALVTDPTCTVVPIAWTDPPQIIQAQYPTEDSSTRSAAVVSHIFRRETETDGGLGVQLAMIDRRLEGHSRVFIKVDQFCCLDAQQGGVDCTDPSVAKKTSCRRGDTLLIEPESNIPSSTLFKYVMAHEFGHFIQANSQGMIGHDYDATLGLAQPKVCTCDLVRADDSLHCLQSVEEPSSAGAEGFGQYFASKVWNRDGEADCTFVYYKNFAAPTCMPGAECMLDDATGLQVNLPPFPLSCVNAAKWRNTYCLGASPSAELLKTGTEYDWVQFLYGVGRDDPDAPWSMRNIFDAYLVACAQGTSADWAICTGKRVGWAQHLDPDPTKNTFGLLPGAEKLMGPDSLMAGAFRNAGDTYGVNDIAPAP